MLAFLDGGEAQDVLVVVLYWKHTSLNQIVAAVLFFECRNNTDSDLQAQGKDLERLKWNTVAR